MKPKQHLFLRGSKWYFIYRLPKELQPLYGNKTKIQQALGTDSLSEAQKLRNALLLDIESKRISLGTNPLGERYRALVAKIQGEHSKLQTNEEFEAFDSYYDVDSLRNSDPLQAAAVLEATGHNPPPELKAPSTEYTLQEIGEMYLNHITKSGIGATTIRNTKRALEKFKTFKLGKESLIVSIDRPTVVMFIEHLKLSLQPKSINTLMSCLNRIHAYGYDRGYITSSSPFKDHTIKDKRTKIDSYKPFSLEQWQTLLPILEDEANTYAKKWIAPIGLMTGMRINEICGLHKEDIYKESNDQWFISLHEGDRTLKTKNSIRKVPIHDSILPAILKLKETSDNKYLIKEVATSPSNRSGTIATWFSRNKVKHITKDSSIAFHSLRGMLATALESAEVPEVTAAAILGHKINTLSYGVYSSGAKPELLSRYLDQASGELREFIDCFPKE
ncbi:tyrosine-type recombinase/integrase [Vibrio coralliilyticus]|uniref:tyrosine-type recombinase/integrase n=1 Tax=Vibrio coralliilyticus TaxID=190893 RepID=UPI002FD74174